MPIFRTFAACLLLLSIMSLVVGCRKGSGPPPAAGPMVVPVSHPIKRNVVDQIEYTGRTDAVSSVGVRARVTGYIKELPFREGSEVKKGDLIFEIDPRPYEAVVEQAKGQVALAEAGLKLAEANFERSKIGFEKGAGSQQDVDQMKGSVEQSKAQIKANRATLEAAQLNVGFTKYLSPIDGQVSRYYYTIGNLVNENQTLVTTVVSVDPMYAYFDMDERTILRIRMAINQGKIKARSLSIDYNSLRGLLPIWSTIALGMELPVFMALEGEEGYPHEGHLNFVNNVVNPSTATIAVRGVFPNPLPPEGRRLISPGMFVRIRLPIGQPYPGLLVVDRAIGSDQGLKYIYVVTPDHKVEYRRIKTGALQDDGLRVVEPFDAAAGTGIKPDDLIVVGAIQQLRPKMDVDPDLITMPSAVPATSKPAGGS